MSGVPPPEGSSPPRYVAYPRSSDQYGSADRLQALGEGYYGLNWVFLINILASLVVYLFARLGWTGYFASLFVEVVLITVLIYRQNLKIAFGKGWSQSVGGVVSLLMGLSSALCCGIFGYIIMQQIASSEMKRYGLKSGFLGVKRRNWQAAVEALRASASMPAPPPEIPGL